MTDSILYFGRKNCRYSDNLKKFLSKKAKKLYYIGSSKIYEKIPKTKITRSKYSYIICFRSFYILKRNLINKATVAAINFHPGTPNYRGTGCVNYALFENAKYYGSTCHIINEKVDNGKIIDVKKFRLRANDTIETTLKKTYLIMLSQAKSVLNILFENEDNMKLLIKKNKNIKWSNKIKKLNYLNKFYKIKLNCSKREIKNKIRATNTKFFKPYIVLHKKKFIYSDD